MAFLFKYMSNPKFLLEDGYMRATQLSALNDPFEAVYCEDSLSKLSSHFEGCIEKEELNNYIKEHKHKIGVISFSEDKENLLMWAHYADNYKGALIGFYFDTLSENIFENLVTSSSSSFLGFELFNGNCLPVKYRKQPIYSIDKFDRDYSNISAEGEDRILFEIFQQKSNEWIYEKEHRITLKLEQADKVILSNYNIYNGLPWLKMLLDSSYTELHNNKLSIYLDRIKNSVDRLVYGKILADLAKDDSENIYLFKISSSCIWSLSYGYRADEINLENIQSLHPIKVRETYKTKINNSYTIEFEEIN